MALGDDLRKQTKNSVRNENRRRNSQKEKVEKEFRKFLQKEVSKFMGDLKETLKYHAGEGRRSVELTICSLRCINGHIHLWFENINRGTDIRTDFDLASVETCFLELRTFCQKGKLRLKLRKEPRLEKKGGYRIPFQYLDLKADISW